MSGVLPLLLLLQHVAATFWHPMFVFSGLHTPTPNQQLPKHTLTHCHTSRPSYTLDALRVAVNSPISVKLQEEEIKTGHPFSFVLEEDINHADWGI